MCYTIYLGRTRNSSSMRDLSLLLLTFFVVNGTIKTIKQTKKIYIPVFLTLTSTSIK